MTPWAMLTLQPNLFSRDFRINILAVPCEFVLKNIAQSSHGSVAAISLFWADAFRIRFLVDSWSLANPFEDFSDVSDPGKLWKDFSIAWDNDSNDCLSFDVTWVGGVINVCGRQIECLDFVQFKILSLSPDGVTETLGMKFLFATQRNWVIWIQEFAMSFVSSMS